MALRTEPPAALKAWASAFSAKIGSSDGKARPGHDPQVHVRPQAHHGQGQEAVRPGPGLFLERVAQADGEDDATHQRGGGGREGRQGQHAADGQQDAGGFGRPRCFNHGNRLMQDAWISHAGRTGLRSRTV